jgi:hypothetical protein
MRTTKISSNTAYPFICSFDGSSVNSKVGLKTNPILRAFVEDQIGKEAANLFNDDFINYKEGFILCQNVDVLLNKIFGSTAAGSTGSSGSSAASEVPTLPNLRKIISFTVVRMPSTFKNQKGNLSSNYAYGEKLKVSVSLEPLEDVGTGKPPNSQQSTGPIKNNKFLVKPGVLFLVYRDANIIARTLKSQSGGGGGIGVWS